MSQRNLGLKYVDRRLSGVMMLIGMPLFSLFAPFDCAQTSTVAEVEYLCGAAIAQQANATPLIIGMGSMLTDGERNTTSDSSLAIIELQVAPA
jgi:hypothetical protein